MKLVQYPFYCHDKNKESMQRMCAAVGITFEATNDFNRMKQGDYDYAWLPTQWVAPEQFPLHVKLIYGPQHFVFPDPAKEGVCGPKDSELSKRAIYLCLSDWIYTVFHEFSSSFRIPICPFPFGIKDLPPRDLSTASLDCIVYSKRRHPAILTHVLKTIQEMQLTSQTFSYGSYKDHEYQTALQHAKLIIWVGCHESQGFAFQEAMSRNIPVLVIDAETMFDEYNEYTSYRGVKELKATSASWWCAKGRCGEKIAPTDDLKATLTHMLANIHKYNPAEFVREHLSDKVCMERILTAFHQE